MALPSKLKNFQCHAGSAGRITSYIGKIEEVELPKLTRKLEEYRGGGMDGPVSIDLGQEKLEMKLKTGGHVTDLYRDYARPGINGVQLRFSGAYQQDDTCEVLSVEIYCRGRISEIDPGTGKLGDGAGESFGYALNYYRLRVNGEDIIEIDLEKMICTVDGIDRLAEIRAAIGLFNPF